MTIFELQLKYTEEDLCYYPGENDLRFKAFAPLFRTLHQSRIIYRERNFYLIATLSGLQLNPQGLAADAKIYRKIERDTVVPVTYPPKPWRFACNWGDLRLVNIALNAPHVGFTLWPQASLVSSVERLVSAGDHDGAYAALYPKAQVPLHN